MTDIVPPTPIPSGRWPRAILHLDMDAFFVNVHLLDHPEHRGKPLATGGRPDQRGVVSSASYEARQFGVHSAMPAAQAVRLCPPLLLVATDWARVRACSRAVMDILRAFGPLEPMSVDEAYIDLGPADNPRQVAVQIRTQVKEQTGLPCSVGLAGSKLVAKVASDYGKPEGFTVVEPGAEAGFLAPQATRVLLGIGPRTAERLAALGIHTCGELAAADLGRLRTLFGRHAEHLQRLAQGIDEREVVSEPGQAKSLSQERTFKTDIDNADYLRAKLASMCPALAQALQQQGLVAHTVAVKFRRADFTTFTRQKSVAVGMDSAEIITQLAQTIFARYWAGEKLRLLGVGVSRLEPAQSHQLTLGLDV